jgi:two-component system, LytTR family, response regulator
MMIQAVLADDEVLARQKMRQLLRDEPDIDIVGECATASETIQLVSAVRPQLLFLDIRMPDMDGFDVLAALSLRRDVALPHIIFTTASDQHALHAFEVHAIDYLLKPFTAERLRHAVERAREQVDAKEHALHNRDTGAQASNAHLTRLVFKSGGRIVFLPVAEIRWIGAEENYVRLCTDRETHLLRQTMAHLEERLDPKAFLRVHRSFIVNLHYVKEVRTQPDGESSVVLISGQKIAMSRSYRARMQEQLHS